MNTYPKTLFLALLTVTLSLSACGSNSTNTTDNSTIETSPEVTPTSEPVSIGTCSYDLEATKEALLKQSKIVINNWLGNIWNNADLELLIFKAEKIAEDPRCESEATAISLPQTIDYAKRIQKIGEQRVQDTLDRSRLSMPKF